MFSAIKIRNVLAQLLPYCVLFLIFFGALVTSHGAGLSVPDWPTTFNQNMFTYPVEKWTGGIFYEHGHRLIASGIGFLTLLLTILIVCTESRKYLVRTSLCGLAMVICQGVLGGLTVIYKLPTAISSAHAILGQTFFLVTIFIAYSYAMKAKSEINFTAAKVQKIKRIGLILSILVYLQLIIAAIMRHSGAGLAVPDFPTMGGSLIPSWSAETLTYINQSLLALGFAPVTELQVAIHLLHRLGAIVILICTLYLWIVATQQRAQISRSCYRHIIILWILILLQFTLGVITVLSQKHPLITSFHVMFGAVMLGLSFLFYLRMRQND